MSASKRDGAYVPFMLQAELASPVVQGNGYLTLDALLGAAVFSITHNPDILSDIPLKSSFGVFHGSQAFFHSRGVTFGAYNFVRKMGGDDFEPDAWVPEKKSYKVQTAREYTANLLGSRDYINATHAVWFGMGDMDRVMDLLSAGGVTSIGAKRGQGFGQVAMDAATGEIAWSIQPLTQDFSMSIHGRPSRPVPMDVWLKIGGSEDVFQGETAIALPSWSAPRVICALPERNVVNISTLIN